ncbi:septum formation protein [Angomonas deanei]|uniref:Maf-like protein, putative n=1 Tax=Angomonas deanei TaxID=59799 RepID=A0A7G2CBM8_9TRYP|nr:septum formation protein [Angomonas deanei]CAD2216334.1 Maf-like protein, putative [Angomonas deanei]|eukprot:EPY42692.1 septum formation protein [Angomonas deanei]
MKPVMLIGTSARRRREIAESHFSRRYHMEYLSPGIDEKEIRSDDPYELTHRIAEAKMDALLTRVQDNSSLVGKIQSVDGAVAITFDQVVFWNGQIREKPESREEAIRFIKDYSASQLSTVQSTCVYSFTLRKRLSQATHTTTYYETLSEDDILRVVAQGDCLHSAGAFVVENADMKKHMIKIDPGTEEEVQGFSASTVEHLLSQL